MISFATADYYISQLSGTDSPITNAGGDHADLAAARASAAQTAATPQLSLWNRSLASIRHYLDQRAINRHYAQSIRRLEELTPHLLHDIGIDTEIPTTIHGKPKVLKFVDPKPVVAASVDTIKEAGLEPVLLAS